MDAAIHAKAGLLMLAACKMIGTMNTGEVCVTPGIKLFYKDVKDMVGPVWYDGGHGEAYGYMSINPREDNEHIGG